MLDKVELKVSGILGQAREINKFFSRMDLRHIPSEEKALMGQSLISLRNQVHDIRSEINDLELAIKKLNGGGY